MAKLTSFTAAWDESTDDVGVAGYRVYFDDGPPAETQETSATFDKLTCGSQHKVDVEAFDAKGRTSERATLTTGTADCDVTPPSPPGGLAVVSRDERSIVLEWDVAPDDWRTARYYVDHDGVLAGATPDTSVVVPGLECGTSYELGVRALDSAGNRSGRGTLTAATADCPPDQPVEPPADLFVAPGGSDQAPCTQAAPCKTFQRAYDVAAPGDVVEAAGGDYGLQRILGAPGRSGPDVTIRPADGARVVFSQLTLGDIGDDRAIGPAHLTLRGMHGAFREPEPGGGNQGGIFVGPGSSHVTLDDMDAGSVQAIRASHLTVRGGDYGPCDAVWGTPAAAICGNNVLDVSTDVLIDGARIHDFRFDETCLTIEGAECHWECMYVNGGERVTIRNSRFDGCTIFDIFTTISGPRRGRHGPQGPDDREQLVRDPVDRGRGRRQPGPPVRGVAVVVPELRPRLPRRQRALQLVRGTPRASSSTRTPSATSRTSTSPATSWPGTAATTRGRSPTTCGAPSCGPGPAPTPSGSPASSCPTPSRTAARRWTTTWPGRPAPPTASCPPPRARRPTPTGSRGRPPARAMREPTSARCLAPRGVPERPIAGSVNPVNSPRVLYSFPHRIGAGRICYTAWEQVAGLHAAGAAPVVHPASVHRPLPDGVCVRRRSRAAASGCRTACSASCAR